MKIRASMTILAVLSLLAAGCGGRTTYAPFGGPRVRLVDEFDEYDELFDREDATPSQRPDGTGSRKARRRSKPRGPREYELGVRSGALLFANADIREPDGRLLIGGFYRRQVGPGMLEIGIDVGANTADMAGEDLFMGRVDYLFALGGSSFWLMRSSV